ncbi:unnamed protein product [Meloidogyne enterolobii]|uniref:Uncharacterized protein n=1 Tax=Meloidogyne enterolobii TaxID=390850 RepID=A0ACB0YQE7_MELEN
MLDIRGLISCDKSGSEEWISEEYLDVWKDIGLRKLWKNKRDMRWTGALRSIYNFGITSNRFLLFSAPQAKILRFLKGYGADLFYLHHRRKF